MLAIGFIRYEGREYLYLQVLYGSSTFHVWRA
jgi:hypothetical protein